MAPLWTVGRPKNLAGRLGKVINLVASRSCWVGLSLCRVILCGARGRRATIRIGSAYGQRR